MNLSFHPLFSFVCSALLASQLLFTVDLAVAAPPPSSSSSSTTTTTTPVTGAAVNPETRFKVPAQPQAVPATQRMFPMPGVVALEGDKWIGADYLGFLPRNIGIEIEVVKGVHAPELPSDAAFKEIAAGMFKKYDIDPVALVIDGPPLPSLHFLLIIYPVAKDRFVISASARLFEEIEVIRKGFNPTGFWQGITWESQDIILVNGDQLSLQAQGMVEKLAQRFLNRYELYNPRTGLKQATIHSGSAAPAAGTPATGATPAEGQAAPSGGGGLKTSASGGAIPPGSAPTYQKSIAPTSSTSAHGAPGGTGY